MILNTVSAQQNDTIIIQSDDSAERITRDLDSLVSNWYVKMAYTNLPGRSDQDTMTIPVSDSVYIDRLSRINSVIRLPYNNIIRNHIQV